MSRQRAILFVEDDRYFLEKVLRALASVRTRILTADNPKDALDLLKENQQICMAVLDVAMPDAGLFPIEQTKAGFETGVPLAIRIREKYPHIAVVGFSGTATLEVAKWFSSELDGYYDKSQLRDLVHRIKERLNGRRNFPSPRIFVVHGHDDGLIAQLKAMLKRMLKGAEIIVLRELPGEGRTIIEKFEQESDRADISFVLLTPDDMAFPKSQPEKIKGRARQNVVFELGYFYAKLQRTRGRVVVLCKGDVERPSDISGIEYIDITDGLNAAKQQIQQVLANWL